MGVGVDVGVMVYVTLKTPPGMTVREEGRVTVTEPVVREREREGVCAETRVSSRTRTRTRREGAMVVPVASPNGYISSGRQPLTYLAISALVKRSAYWAP